MLRDCVQNNDLDLGSIPSSIPSEHHKSESMLNVMAGQLWNACWVSFWEARPLKTQVRGVQKNRSKKCPQNVVKEVFRGTLHRNTFLGRGFLQKTCRNANQICVKIRRLFPSSSGMLFGTQVNSIYPSNSSAVWIL